MPITTSSSSRLPLQLCVCTLYCFCYVSFWCVVRRLRLRVRLLLLVRCAAAVLVPSAAASPFWMECQLWSRPLGDSGGIVIDGGGHTNTHTHSLPRRTASFTSSFASAASSSHWNHATLSDRTEPRTQGSLDYSCCCGQGSLLTTEEGRVLVLATMCTSHHVPGIGAGCARSEQEGKRRRKKKKKRPRLAGAVLLWRRGRAAALCPRERSADEGEERRGGKKREA